jgi:hypothetical protein
VLLTYGPKTKKVAWALWALRVSRMLLHEVVPPSSKVSATRLPAPLTRRQAVAVDVP